MPESNRRPLRVLNALVAGLLFTGPKFIYDVIEGGPRTYIFGVAVGSEF